MLRDSAKSTICYVFILIIAFFVALFYYIKLISDPAISSILY